MLGSRLRFVETLVSGLFTKSGVRCEDLKESEE
jgi:hypothetical protein